MFTELGEEWVQRTNGTTGSDRAGDPGRSRSLPPCLAIAQQSWHDGRSLCFRYVRDHDGASSDREAVPHRVYCKWGHWYFQGRELDEAEPKQFRIDRMLDAHLGEVEFDPPPDTEIPAWFDLSEHERTITLRLTPAQLDALPPGRTQCDRRRWWLTAGSRHGWRSPATGASTRCWCASIPRSRSWIHPTAVNVNAPTPPGCSRPTSPEW
jgi:WYL domain